MILFEEDWERYPGAIVDTQTRNKSFLRVASLYKEMGVKNHTFLLALHNKELQGVDPHDPHLTIEQMAMVAIECKQNPWYFFREVARAPGRSGSDPIMFRAHRGNIALYWLFFNHITVILIQIRQTGKSFASDTLMDYLMNIRCTNTEINLLTKDDTLRSANIERLKEIDSELPFYLKQRTKSDLANTEELTIKALGNRYRGHLPNKSPKMALNVGRGLTSPIFQIDEAAFLFNIAISLPAALAAGTAARDIARVNDEPHGTILTTTAGKKDDRDGRYVHTLVQNSAVWTESFLDARNLTELELLIRKSSPRGELRVNCTFNHRQLGYSDAWLKKAIEDAMVDGDAADRDFFNVWTSGTQSSPLSIETLERIRASQRNDFNTEISQPYGYVTRWYVPLEDVHLRMNSSHFVLAIDSSDAAGGDDISLILRDIRTGEVIAAGNYNETNLITFAEWLVSWFVRFENFVAIIERRSSGAMILDYIILMLVSKGIDPFKRLFNRVVNDYDEHPDRFKEISVPFGRRDQSVYVHYKKHFGFATSGAGLTSRNDLYSTTFLSAAKVTADLVYDLKTIDQITSLTTRNGRIDHEEGGNDDMVISWLLSYWFMTKGKNLSFYGINSRDILVNNKRNVEHIKTPQEQYFALEQQQIREEIERIFDQIRNERDEFVIKKLEMNLRVLNTKLVLQDGEKFSLDELIDSLHQERRYNRTVKQLQHHDSTQNRHGVSYSNSSYFGRS